MIPPYYEQQQLEERLRRHHADLLAAENLKEFSEAEDPARRNYCERLRVRIEELTWVFRLFTTNSKPTEK